nr:hypothetical protein [Tanacetum cinerariifolium]
TKSPIEEPKHSFNIGYEPFNTNLVTNDVAKSSTKNLVPIPRECEVVSNNGSESIEHVKDNPSVFTTISNPLLDNDEINSDESNSVESTSNLDTVKFDNLDEFSGPLIPIHILRKKESGGNMESTLIEWRFQDNDSQREEMDIITSTDDVLHLGVENDDSDGEVDAVDDLPLIPIQDNDSRREEIDIVTNTDKVLPLGVENDDDSEGEIDVVEELHVDNSISNSANELSVNEESDFDNPSV